MFNLTALSLHFTCEAVTPLQLGGWHAGSNLRGALGNVMRRAYCGHGTPTPAPLARRSQTARTGEGASTPPLSSRLSTTGEGLGVGACPVCWLLAANEHPGEERRGYALTPPRETCQVFGNLTGLFTFGLTLFGDAQRYLPYFILAVPEMGRLGLGPGRGQFALRSVIARDPLEGHDQIVLAEGEALVRVPDRLITPDRILRHCERLFAKQSPASDGCHAGGECHSSDGCHSERSEESLAPQATKLAMPEIPRAARNDTPAAPCHSERSQCHSERSEESLAPQATKLAVPEIPRASAQKLAPTPALPRPVAARSNGTGEGVRLAPSPVEPLLFDGGGPGWGQVSAPTHPAAGWGSRNDTPDRVRLNFLTPLRLIDNGCLVKAPDFGVLFKRLLERLDELNVQYSGGTPRPSDDVHALQTLANQVRLIESQTQWIELQSGSSRTGRATPISGFIGCAEYGAPFGVWRTLLPWLLWGTIAQVGKDVVKGNGVFEILKDEG